MDDVDEMQFVFERVGDIDCDSDGVIVGESESDVDRVSEPVAERGVALTSVTDGVCELDVVGE